MRMLDLVRLVWGGGLVGWWAGIGLLAEQFAEVAAELSVGLVSMRMPERVAGLVAEIIIGAGAGHRIDGQNDCHVTNGFFG
jgi:hypothetical protein